MSEYVSSDQRQLILDAAVVQGNFVLASGIVSTEKFEFDRISDKSKAFAIAINGLAACIKSTVNFDEHEAIGLVTVATGANRLGDPLADLLHMYHIPSRKDDEGNLYIPERTDGLTGIFVDDVYTTGSSFEKVKTQFRGRVIGAYAILDRSGKTNPILTDGTKVESVIKKVL